MKMDLEMWFSNDAKEPTQEEFPSKTQRMRIAGLALSILVDADKYNIELNPRSKRPLLRYISECKTTQKIYDDWLKREKGE